MICHLTWNMDPFLWESCTTRLDLRSIHVKGPQEGLTEDQRRCGAIVCQRRTRYGADEGRKAIEQTSRELPVFAFKTVENFSERDDGDCELFRSHVSSLRGISVIPINSFANS